MSGRCDDWRTGGWASPCPSEQTIAYAFVTPEPCRSCGVGSVPRLARIIFLVMMVSIADAQDTSFTVSSASCAVDPSSPNCILSGGWPSNYWNGQACTITPTALAIGAPLTATSFCSESCCPCYNMMPPPPPPPLPPFSPFAQSPMISMLAASRMPPLSPQAPPPPPPPPPPSHSACASVAAAVAAVAALAPREAHHSVRALCDMGQRRFVRRRWPLRRVWKLRVR